MSKIVTVKVSFYARLRKNGFRRTLEAKLVSFNTERYPGVMERDWPGIGAAASMIEGRNITGAKVIHVSEYKE